MMVENTRAGALDMPTFQAVAMNPESRSATIFSSEQVELVYTQAPVALGAALVVAALLSLALWNVADHTWLLFWFDLQLLQTAAVIGRECDFDILREVSGRTEEEAIATLEILVGRGLLLESEREDGISLDFSHHKLRTLISS